jgi:small membrane protein
MNLFQWITLPTLGLLFLVDLRNLVFRRPAFRMDRALRCLVWLLAGIAIYEPGITVIVANAIGIQRGADLILYLLVLTFVATAFSFYSRQIRLERTMTKIVRYIALQEAKRESPAAASALLEDVT